MRRPAPHSRLRRLAAGAALAVALTGEAHAEEVDLKLVLALDSSTSVNQRNYGLEAAGIAAAFADPRVLAAIDKGAHKSIAVAVMEWADYGLTAVTVDWHVIRGPADALAFARAVATAPRRVPGGVTSLSGAIDGASALMGTAPVTAERQVIDIAGDGRNSDGRPVTEARDDAVARGFVINGLAIASDVPTLPLYYRDKVMGGAGSFVLEVADFKGFAEGIRAKLVREIEGGFLGTGLPPRRRVAEAE
jgi:hypothetical protein